VKELYVCSDYFFLSISINASRIRLSVPANWFSGLTTTGCPSTQADRRNKERNRENWRADKSCCWKGLRRMGVMIDYLLLPSKGSSHQTLVRLVRELAALERVKCERACAMAGTQLWLRWARAALRSWIKHFSQLDCLYRVSSLSP
jgi:hypothetical protein